MKIIISPAKKMNIEDDVPISMTAPALLKNTAPLLKYLKGLDYDQLKVIWRCNDKIAGAQFENLKSIDLESRLTPAIFAYEGLQYQYLKPQLLTDEELLYLQNHLRILSGLYGVVKPFDGVVPYRLEMQTKTNLTYRGKHYPNLYEYWGDKIAKIIQREMKNSGEKVILNLASKEYSKVVEPYLPKGIRLIECVWYEEVIGKNDEKKMVVKGTNAKMARGELGRFMAQNRVDSIEDVKRFTGMGYRFQGDLSDENRLVYLRECNKESGP